jgi:Leucine-rich repeat (LRR) protein
MMYSLATTTLVLLVAALICAEDYDDVADCPALDSNCSCLSDNGYFMITCQNLGTRTSIPQFATNSSTIFDMITIGEDDGASTVTSIGPKVFSGLHTDALYLIGLRSVRVDSAAFSGLGTDVTYLELSGNLFQSLPDRLFDGLESLDSLELKSNQIVGLRIEVFNGLTSLTSLDLSSNILTSIDTSPFANIGNLLDLKLSSNKLTGIGEYVSIANCDL